MWRNQVKWKRWFYNLEVIRAVWLMVLAADKSVDVVLL
jgi:hypothetical protein